MTKRNTKMKISCNYFLLFCLFLCSSCTNHSDRALCEIEEYIQQEPIRALTELRTINTKTLNSGKDKALYSLLYSMALDKNYIDTKTDSLIATAVKYYSHTNDEYHKFLSYYYQGRVYENAEQYQKALNSFIRAEEHLSCRRISKEYAVRLYTAKERVYYRQFALDLALESCRKAMDYSKDLEDSRYYIRNSLDAYNICYNNGKPEEADVQLKTLEKWLEDRSLPKPSEYYQSAGYILIFQQNGEKEQIESVFNHYLSACEAEGVEPDPLFETIVYIKTLKYDKAKESFNRANLNMASTTFDTLRYYSAEYNLYKVENDLDRYIRVRNEYLRIRDRQNVEIFNNDVRFLEERFQNERVKEKRKRVLTATVSFLSLLLIITFAGVVRWRKKEREYKAAIQEAKEESGFLSALIQQNGAMAEDIKTLIQNRIKALTPYIQKIPSKQFGREDLKRLQYDNIEMLRNVGLLYSLSFPGFVSELVGYGLTAEEVGICSLYASGFISKDISDIIGRGGIYHINCNVRAKIGVHIGNRTLPVWLRERFSKYHPAN